MHHSAQQNTQKISAGAAKDEDTDRTTNYLILRTLEQKLTPQLFQNLLKTVGSQLEMPSHTAWDGQTHQPSYQQLKVSQSSADSQLLRNLVAGQSQKNLANFSDSSSNNSLIQALKGQASLDPAARSNLHALLTRALGPRKSIDRKGGAESAWEHFDRVKTVFGHTDFSTDEVSSIYNVYFDQKGDFIISAGDEGTIKVWDRHTLTLQASLHGHDDYITEIDISKCNRFIASAGKDAQIIIWELATGKILYRLQKHTRLINCIKFFTPKMSDGAKVHEQQQYLFSCSDDGTVMLYDVTPISGWRVEHQRKLQAQEVPRKSSEEDFRIRRSNRQKPTTQTQTSADANSQPEQLHSVELTPDDYRPGTRNKKLDTLVMNHSGLVVAGSSTGELLVWRINFDLIQKRVPKYDSYQFLGQFKIGKQSCIKFCEFSPHKGTPNMGDQLLTGSVDGQVIVWDMTVSSWKSFRKDSFVMEDGSRSKITFDEQGCRVIKKVETVENDGLREVSHIPVDITGTSKFKEAQPTTKAVCDAVRWSCNGRFAIASIQCRLEAEGIEICKVKIWDFVEEDFIEDLARLNQIRLPQNTFVLAPHPSKEEILMTGSDNGVLVLWNIHTRQLIKQFKQFGVYSVDANIMDSPLHGSWSPDGKAFASGNVLGTVSFYASKDVAHQYDSTRVQQFFQYDLERQNTNPFEQITERPQICSYNMIPYEVQPDRFLIRFKEPRFQKSSVDFNRSLVVAKELGQMEERYYQDKLQQSLFQDHGADQLLQPIESISMIQPPLQNEEDADMTDMMLVNQLQQRADQREEEPRRRVGRPRLQRTNERRTSSVDQVQSSSEESQSDDSEQVSLSSEENEEMDSDQDATVMLQRGGRLRRNTGNRTNQTGRNPARPVRAARPANLRDIDTYGDNSMSEASRIQRRTRRVREIESQSEDESERPQPQLQHTQRYQRNQNRQRRNRNISDQSFDEESESEVPRGRHFVKKRNLSEEEYSLSHAAASKLTNYLSDCELDVETETHTDYSSHMLIAASKRQGQKYETAYELQRDGEVPVDQACHLCARKEGELMGPFTKGDQKVFLHRECVEVNTYSYYSSQCKKWVNIDTMLTCLKGEKTYTCFRCDLPGASVSCQLCGRNFHGYHCSSLYLLRLPIEAGSKNEGTNPQFWQCFFCQNQNNHNNYLASPNTDEKAYIAQLRKLDKGHLLGDMSHSQREQAQKKAVTIVPQVDDVLVYFWQGHEDFIYQYNCHFYAGVSAIFPKRQMMPWLRSEALKKCILRQPFMLCKVLKVEAFFPARRSIKLIQTYGTEASDCAQTIQLCQRVHLQFIGTCQDKFVVEIFPNELSDFLVPFQTFVQQWHKYKQAPLENKVVQVHLKSRTQRMKIQSASASDSLLSPTSLWQTVVAKQVQQNEIASSRRPQPSTSDETVRINFWQIQFDGDSPSQDHGFAEHEHLKVRNHLQTFMTKNRDYLVYLKERVDEKIAKDYRSIIAQEMWFDLVLQRVNNKYYRSCRQFYADLDQIVLNAQIFNGANHDVAIDAAEIVKRFKQESIKHIDLAMDKQVREKGDLALAICQEIKDAQGITNTEAHVAEIEETKDECVAVASLGYQPRDQARGRTNKRLRGGAQREESPETETINLLNTGEGVMASRTLRKRQRQL